jgi:hypothetical protein
MVMIESISGYYESIRHVMAGLQHASISKYAVRMLLFAAPHFHSHSSFSDFGLDKPEIVHHELSTNIKLTEEFLTNTLSMPQKLIVWLTGRSKHKNFGPNKMSL